MKIYKYDLAVRDVQTVAMPRGAQLLHVAVQDREADYDRRIQLWAAVDTSEEVEQRTFFVVGTGHDCPGPDRAEYVGTVLDDTFVWHVFTPHPYGHDS